MDESDERKSVGSDLSIEEDNMQEIPVLIPECDNVKSPILDSDSDCDDQENLVLSLMTENSAVKIIWDEEDRVTALTTLISLEHNLPNEVMQSIHERQEDIFVQVGEKFSLDEFMIEGRKVMLEFHKTFEASFLMINNVMRIWLSCHMKITYKMFRLPKIRPFRMPFQILLPMFHVL